MKQTLSVYYNSLSDAKAPKTELIAIVAGRCKVNDQTVRNWVKGRSTPQDPEHLQILSEETGIPIENLFTE